MSQPKSRPKQETSAPMATLPASRRIIRLPQVCEMVGLSRTSVYRFIQRGEFPAPIKIGLMSGWLEYEIAAWIDGKINARECGHKSVA